MPDWGLIVSGSRRAPGRNPALSQPGWYRWVGGCGSTGLHNKPLAGGWEQPVEACCLLLQPLWSIHKESHPAPAWTGGLLDVEQVVMPRVVRERRDVFW